MARTMGKKNLGWNFCCEVLLNSRPEQPLLINPFSAGDHLFSRLVALLVDDDQPVISEEFVHLCSSSLRPSCTLIANRFFQFRPSIRLPGSAFSQ